MKKNVLILATFLMVGMLFGANLKAQTNTEEVDLYQSIFGMEKKAIVADFLQLESDDGFWLIYDAYETERKEIGKNRIKALNDYVEGYDKMDDAKFDETIAIMMSLQKSNDKLIDTYYKKVKKEKTKILKLKIFLCYGYVFN